MATTDNMGITLINASDYVDPEAINDGFKALDALGVDYITEQGTSGNWSYRKFKSGVAECWATYETSSAKATESFGSIYYGWHNTGTWPITFSSTPVVTASVSSSTGVVWVGEINVNKTNAMMMICSAQESAINRTVRFHVIGKC